MHDIKMLLDELGHHHNLMDIILSLLLIITRWLSMSMLMPFLGAMLLSPLLRIALALLLSIINLVMLMPLETISDDINLGLLFIKEAMLGLTLGLLSSAIIYAYQICGDIIDYFRAAHMSRLLVPEHKYLTSPLGVFMYQLGLMLFIHLGCHREMIKASMMSFDLFPIININLLIKANLLETTLVLSGKILYISLHLSLPILAVTLLTDISFGLINRISPQINVYFLSLPAKMMGALIILLLVFTLLTDQFILYHQELLSLWPS